MSKQLIQTLLHLAQVDGNVSGSELALIYKIAVAKGVPMFEVEQMIQNPPNQSVDLNDLSNDDRFEYMYNIVLIIKMDGKLDEKEFDMCHKYALALGYHHEVVPELLKLIKSDFDLSINKLALQQKIQKYLN